MEAHVLVPLKRLAGAKTRLAGLLVPDERASLVKAMLADVLDAVRAAPEVATVTLVSSEPFAPRLARTHGVRLFDDGGLPWNEGLAAATSRTVVEPVVAVVSADLPLVSSEDVSALLGAVPERGIAIARAHDGGTNAVAIAPPGAVGTCFGEPGSAALHAGLARAAGLAAAIVDRPGLALDLDTAADVERFLGVPRETRTRSLLVALRAGSRVSA